MNKSSHTSLFLMEMIVSIFLFAAGAAVCIRVFTEAHVREREAKEMEFATLQLQNIAAIIQNKDYTAVTDVVDAIAVMYGVKDKETAVYGSDGEVNMHICFDRSFGISKDGEYILKLSVMGKEGFRTADVSFMPATGEELIFDTTVKCYMPMNTEGEASGEGRDRYEK